MYRGGSTRVQSASSSTSKTPQIRVHKAFPESNHFLAFPKSNHVLAFSQSFSPLVGSLKPPYRCIDLAQVHKSLLNTHKSCHEKHISGYQDRASNSERQLIIFRGQKWIYRHHQTMHWKHHIRQFFDEQTQTWVHIGFHLNTYPTLAQFRHWIIISHFWNESLWKYES